ncbi:conserved hypothetical protein [Verticillium alfalfae VaMs.102]|uniref:Uncharacterized protein n=1 Tax=Verticillium alfalfae (strain VaMs.102 / ATCC MYA-4576 / FGSC 10136) TaxID=526221 RepID=C9SNU3_VERA1|nr:conserved hypothetical protein [Verticillium alfalfae VaMs.102]EEY20458.1 conserved hypothetical protein [Verticillium alfalfae VaMs.102]
MLSLPFALSTTPHVRLSSAAECRLCAVSAGQPSSPPAPTGPGKLEPGGKYWTTRNGSALIAFTVGQKYEPGNGVAMIAGHIDALTARLKPVSTKRNAAGYVQLGVAPPHTGRRWWAGAVGCATVVRAEVGDLYPWCLTLGNLGREVCHQIEDKQDPATTRAAAAPSGPMLSSALGVRAADAGLPQLSMHSIRATTGSLDPGLGVKFFKGFLDHWEKVDAEWQ